jgi:hypothetical protein
MGKGNPFLTVQDILYKLPASNYPYIYYIFCVIAGSTNGVRIVASKRARVSFVPQKLWQKLLGLLGNIQSFDQYRNPVKYSDKVISSEKEMFELADFFLQLHSEKTVDYTRKYRLGEAKKEVCAATEAHAAPEAPLEDTPLHKELKQYRYNTSKAEGVKACFIFTNAQLEELISMMSKSLAELKKVSGFGEVKCQKYGTAIIEIINRNLCRRLLNGLLLLKRIWLIAWKSYPIMVILLLLAKLELRNMRIENIGPVPAWS